MSAEPTTNPSASYSVAEVRTRIGVYIAIAMLTAAGSGVLNLATMTDDQLAKITPLRWTLTLIILAISIASAGLNAFRAAIDRSTAGGNDASSTTPANAVTPPPQIP